MGDEFDMERLLSIANKLWDFSWETREILCNAIHFQMYPDIVLESNMGHIDWSRITDSYQADILLVQNASKRFIENSFF